MIQSKLFFSSRLFAFIQKAQLSGDTLTQALCSAQQQWPKRKKLSQSVDKILAGEPVTIAAINNGLFSTRDAYLLAYGEKHQQTNQMVQFINWRYTRFKNIAVSLLPLVMFILLGATLAISFACYWTKYTFGDGIAFSLTIGLFLFMLGSSLFNTFYRFCHGDVLSNWRLPLLPFFHMEGLKLWMSYQDAIAFGFNMHQAQIIAHHEQITLTQSDNRLFDNLQKLKWPINDLDQAQEFAKKVVARIKVFIFILVSCLVIGFSLIVCHHRLLG